MATLCTTFPSTDSALHAAETLTAAGVRAGEIGVMIGEYARPAWRATEGFGAPADEPPQGSCVDIDRILSVTWQDGDKHVEATDDDRARRLLTRAHLPDDVALRMVRHLHAGEAIMFVQLLQVDLGTAQALIAQSPEPDPTHGQPSAQ